MNTHFARGDVKVTFKTTYLLEMVLASRALNCLVQLL